jgi:hypothetical protein
MTDTHSNARKCALWLCLVILLFPIGDVKAQQGESSCGPLANHYGPYDYRTETGEPSRLVNGAHFLPFVESLIRGKTDITPGHDIDYTLRAFPNHHRALLAMMRLGEKEKRQNPVGSSYTVECWFDRAIRFRPDDTTVRMIFAGYLAKNNRPNEARNQLEYATNLAKDNPFTHYNIGLVYFDMKAYDKALAQAHMAIALGFTRPELPNRLKEAGQWKDPPSTGAKMEAPGPAAPDDVASTPAATPASAPAQ